MRATTFEYRFRFVLHALIFVLGFTAPWNYALHLDPPGPNAHVWGLLTVNLMQLGIRSISVGFNLLLVLAIVCASAGAFLRTWGAAYVGSGVVASGEMHTAGAGPTSGFIEAGPYRFVRNPLYLGTILHSCALALLMPRSGAIFSLVAVTLLQIRLILAEEPFLQERLGARYAAYCQRVPRLLPALTPKIAAQSLVPQWGQAVAGEIYMWGVAGSFAVAGWRYSAPLLMQCVIVSFGVSLVVRALGVGREQA